MHTHPRPVAVRPIAGAMFLALVLAVSWASAPDADLVPLILVGFVAEVVIYGALYLMQRRRHW